MTVNFYYKIFNRKVASQSTLVKRAKKTSSHGNVTVPCDWMNSEITSFDRLVEVVYYFCVFVGISMEHLGMMICIFILVADWGIVWFEIFKAFFLNIIILLVLNKLKI